MIKDIESLLLSVHFMGAQLLSTPELELSEMESEKLADCIKEVAKYHQVNIDPKKLAWFRLMTTMGGIYGSRTIAVMKRHEKEAGAKPPKQAASPGVNGKAPAPAGGVDQAKLGKLDFSRMAPSQLWNEAPTDHGEG